MNRHLPSLCALALLATSCGLQGKEEGVMGYQVGHESSAITGPVCPGPDKLQGIDVSVYQGTINWTSVRQSGRYWAIARAAHGLAADTTFSTNWPKMKAAGLVRGAYLYFVPSQDASAQARLVVSKVGKLGEGDLPVMADVESTGGGLSPSTIASRLATFIEEVEAGTGKKPLIYTGCYFWDDYVKSAAFADHDLVIANYSATCPPLPNAWKQFWAHQYSDTGRVSGITGAVDLDYFNGTLAELQAYAGGTGTVTGTLKGTIFKSPDTAAPISGATVKLDSGQSTTTGATGLYSFDVAPGTYTVTASKTGYGSASVTRTVTAGATIWGSIGLTANTATGDYKGVVFQYNPAKPGDMSTHLTTAQVRIDGGAWKAAGDGFSFTVPAGTHTVDAQLTGYEPNSSTRTVVAGQTIWGSIGLSPKSTTGPAPVVHIVSPLAGAQLQGSEVTVSGTLENSSGVTEVHVKFAGHDVVGPVTGGRFDVAVQVPAGDTTLEVSASNAAGTGTATVLVHYQTGFCGLVQALGGATVPLAGATVELLPAADACASPTKTATSDAEGKFCFDLPEGDYLVRAKSPGRVTVVEPVTVALAAREDVTLQLSEGSDPVPELVLVSPAQAADGKVHVTTPTVALEGEASGMVLEKVSVEGQSVEVIGGKFKVSELAAAVGETTYVFNATGKCGETATLKVTLLREPEAGADAGTPSSSSSDAGTTPEQPKEGGCGCTSGGEGVALLGLVSLLGLRRRREER